ncbi:hypothetical protein AgCh_014318 [Apium graveolens]
MPYGKIDLYIDHSFDFAFPMNDTENEIFNGDLSDSENDPEYFIETESSESDCSSLVDSDEELNEYEISRKRFIGDNLIMDKRRKREKLFKAGHEKEAAIKFKIEAINWNATWDGAGTYAEPHHSYISTAAKDPGTVSKERLRHQELPFGARRRGSPSLVVVGIFETMARPGKHTSGRPSASTQVQEPDHSQALDPGADREAFHEQLLQHTLVVDIIVNTRDARSLIELNQYKYTNVPVAEEHMANLTSDELAEAIRLYRQEQTRLQEEAELEEEPEESGDSQQSKRSVFDRIGAKGMKNTKD